MRAENPRNGRPLIMLCVPCECHHRSHRYPWRGDWPVSASVRSRQKSRCGRKPGVVWLALDPGQLERSREIVAAGHVAFREWAATREAARAAAAEREATP